jgi:polysaccharide deacetylase 2 family uncharacterized protein YibQ
MAAGEIRIRPRTSRPWERFLLAGAAVLVLSGAGIALFLLQRPDRAAPPPPPDLALSTLAVKGLLFDEGATSKDLKQEPGGGGGATLVFQLDPAVRTDLLLDRLGRLLSSLGYSLAPPARSGQGENETLTLTATPVAPGHAAALTLVLAKRQLPLPAPVATRARVSRPRLAIVIDDLGLSLEAAERAASLPAAVTVAVMPRQPVSEESARLARHLGKEVLLHLPMEPLEFPDQDPGPGALLSGMTPEEMAQVLREDLLTVPGAVGVNNHMGSRVSAEGTSMDSLMRQLSRFSLFFLDSRTTPNSLAFQKARSLGLKCIRRDIFLDNLDEPEAIQVQLDELIKLTLSHGEAVGIGHPRDNTFNVLTENLDRIRKAGIDIVPLSRLAR